MPTKYQIQNMLESMNTKELRQVAKHFGVYVTKQSGGYKSKNEIVYDLVGGMTRFRRRMPEVSRRMPWFNRRVTPIDSTVPAPTMKNSLFLINKPLGTAEVLEGRYDLADKHNGDLYLCRPDQLFRIVAQKYKLTPEKFGKYDLYSWFLNTESIKIGNYINVKVFGDQPMPLSWQQQPTIEAKKKDGLKLYLFKKIALVCNKMHNLNFLDESNVVVEIKFYISTIIGQISHISPFFDNWYATDRTLQEEISNCNNTLFTNHLNRILQHNYLTRCQMDYEHGFKTQQQQGIQNTR